MRAAYDTADYLEYFAQDPAYALNQGLSQAHLGLGQAYQGAKNWLSGQIDYAHQVIQSGDSRLLLLMGFNIATSVVTASMIALLAPVIGPAALLIIPAMAIINTAVSNYAYGQPLMENLVPNTAAEMLELAGGAIGGAFGPGGALIGTAIGAGAGQVLSNLLTDRPPDEGLLFNMALATLTEGVGMAAGRVGGARLRNWLDADADIRARRVAAAEAWASAGADLDDPNVRRLIQRGRGPVVGGSGGGSSIRYAPALESGLPRKLQRDLVQSVDEGGIIGVCSRPYRAAELEWKYPAKKGWVKDWMVVKKYKGGVRRLLDADRIDAYEHVRRVAAGYKITDLKGYQWFISNEEFTAVRRRLRGQRVLSDLDVAGYTVHGRVVSNEEFLGTFRKRFNEAYGYELITHGPFVHGLDQPDVVAGFTWDRFRGLQERDVYVFDKSGFVEKLPYYQYEAKYLNDYRVKLWEQLRAHYAERGINLEGIKMSSFYDIEEWIGPEYNRLWFGTSPASGIIGSKGSQPGFPDDLLREPSPGHMLRLLESRRLGGVPGEAVAGNVWAMKRAIDRLGNPDVEGQIIFNLHGRIVEGSFTWEELKYIAEHENPLIRERTRIVIDWYY